MSNFFYRRLNFFNKEGKPLNFDYIGPTGPTPLDSVFTYITSSTVTSNGNANFNSFDVDPGYVVLYQSDINGSSLDEWTDEVVSFLQQGANVYLDGRIASQNQFRGQIESLTVTPGVSVQVNFVQGKISGQRIISPGNKVYLRTSYDYRPGGYFKGNIYFDPISAGLYGNEQIFVVQELYNPYTSSFEYGLPHTGATGNPGVWRSRWYNDKYGETDVSEIIFTYGIDDTLPDGDGNPLIISYPNMVFGVTSYESDVYAPMGGGYIQSDIISSEALTINVGLNTNNLSANIYERKLIIEDISSGTPQKVLEVDFYGEVVGEDERFQVLLQNLGRAFYNSDSVILRDHDPAEPLPNYIEINEKRKELLVAGEQIFPYIGSYKGLINAIRFFGYQDLRIKEYWLNLEYKKSELPSPLQRNKAFLDEIKAQQAVNGYTQNYQIADLLDNQNSGKYKMVQTYGPDKDGNYVLDVSSQDDLVPSRTYKKTALFGLYYDLNKLTGDETDYGYPEVVDAFKFTQEEVLLKIFALKERLKADYLPLNARIVDITGEGIYFDVFNNRSWTDQMERPDIDAGLYIDVKSNPDFGFIEDLRNFNVRPLSTSIQTPSTYFDSYSAQVTVGGGTGSAIFITGIPATGPNPSISVRQGDTYSFTMGSTGYTFYLTTDSTLSSVVDPVGVENNGATAGGNTLVWYVNPLQSSPVYYFCPENPSLLNGSITVYQNYISDLGNISNPLDNQQMYTAEQNSAMIDAISNFYYLKQQGQIQELGDGKFDPPAYIDPTTGLPYKIPVGMPLILELIVDRWTWDELSINWSAVILPVFSVGDRVQVKKANSPAYQEFGEVVGVSYSTGVYEILIDGDVSTSFFDESDLFAPFQIYGILTWGNIDFSNMVEIEWIIEKSSTQEGTPYYFEYRGPILDFYQLAHFVPYTGEYKISCNVYDGFNVKSTVIKSQAIKVNPKIIEIDAWTRFREIEDYRWTKVSRSWDQYQSIWEYPAEGKTSEEAQKTIPSEVLDFATYGNKADDGQDVYVKVETQPIGATGTVSFTQLNYSITDITSYEYAGLGGQYGFATITTSTPHNLQSGYEVTIFNSIPEINGRWKVIVSSGATNTFRIPLVLQNTWNNVVTQTSPNRLSVDSTIYTNQYFTGSGTITLYVDGKEIAYAEAGDTLYSTANAIVSSANSLRTYPDYFASCENPGADPVTIMVSAPNELGADQNGVSFQAVLTGSLSLVSASSELDYGVSPDETYVYWSENNENLPNKNLKYWGTKNLNWNVFTDSTWENGYAHSYYDFEFNNDWLGGFELHNIQPGDYIKLSTGNQSYPFPVGITIAPGVSGPITIQEVADQLNASTDRYITDFYYRPIPNEAGGLPTNTPPINLDVVTFGVPNSVYPAPISLIGGSPLLRVGFGYTGGTPITTTTSTTTTSTTTTSTSTTSTSTTSTSTTSTTSTTTSTTSTTSTTTSTTSTTTSTTTTSTSTTTTAVPTYTINFRSSVYNSGTGIIGVYYSFDQISWTDLGDSTAIYCAGNGAGSISNLNIGDTVYVYVTNQSGQDIRFAKDVASCVGAPSLCGPSSPAVINVTGDMVVYLNMAYSGGFVTC